MIEVKFQIFGTDTCRACDHVKTVLIEKNLPYEFVNINDSIDNANLFSIYYPTERTIPQVRYDGEHVASGFKQFHSYLNSIGK